MHSLLEKSCRRGCRGCPWVDVVSVAAAIEVSGVAFWVNVLQVTAMAATIEVSAVAAMEFYTVAFAVAIAVTAVRATAVATAIDFCSSCYRGFC
jgi:hypothetical protein